MLSSVGAARLAVVAGADAFISSRAFAAAGKRRNVWDWSRRGASGCAGRLS
jgi:hypothetical protein